MNAGSFEYLYLSCNDIFSGRERVLNEQLMDVNNNKDITSTIDIYVYDVNFHFAICQNYS